MTNKPSKKPILSVYMPAFNAANFVSAAIESVISQTYRNFEFIIVDDASTDSTWKIIQAYAAKDKRIRTFRNKVNLGVSLTSNIAISLTHGQLLARIEADDVAFPDRFQKQIDFLKNNPQVVAVGGQCVCIDADNKIIGYKKFPIEHSKLVEMIFWAIPLQQPSIMINLSLLPKSFTWYDRKTSAEEIDVIFSFLKYGQIANLPEYLLYYRQLPTSLSHRNPKQTFYLTLESRIKAVKNGFMPSFRAVFLNLAQVIAVSVLPSSAINSLWNFLRGINNNDTNFKVGAYANVTVKE